MVWKYYGSETSRYRYSSKGPSIFPIVQTSPFRGTCLRLGTVTGSVTDKSSGLLVVSGKSPVERTFLEGLVLDEV